jgi:hypothetical protein
MLLAKRSLLLMLDKQQGKDLLLNAMETGLNEAAAILPNVS